MKKRNQKLLSLFLSAMMVVGVVPSTVYAAPEQATEIAVEQEAGTEATNEDTVINENEADASADQAQENTDEAQADDTAQENEAAAEGQTDAQAEESGKQVYSIGKVNVKFEGANAAVAEALTKDVEIDENDPAIQGLRKELENLEIVGGEAGASNNEANINTADLADEDGQAATQKLTDEQIDTVVKQYQNYLNQWKDNANLLGVQNPFFLDFNDDKDGLGILGEMLALDGKSVQDVRDGKVKYDDLTGMIFTFNYGDKLGIQYYGKDVENARTEALAAVDASGAQTKAQKLLVLNDWLAHNNTFDMSYIMNSGKETEADKPMIAKDPKKQEHEDDVYNEIYKVYEPQIKQNFHDQIYAGVKQELLVKFYKNAIANVLVQGGQSEEDANAYVEANKEAIEKDPEAFVKENLPQAADSLKEEADKFIKNAEENGVEVSEGVTMTVEQITQQQLDSDDPALDMDGDGTADTSFKAAIPIYAQQAATGMTTGVINYWEGSQFGAFGMGTSVCLGYSKAFTYLVQCLDKEVYLVDKNGSYDSGNWKTAKELYYGSDGKTLDINAGYTVDLVRISFQSDVTMYGEEQENFGSDHYWNAVKVDGQWYYVDPCYTDVYTEVMSRDRVETDGDMSHAYFLFSDTSARKLYDGNFKTLRSLYADENKDNTSSAYEKAWTSRAASNVYYADGYAYYMYDSTDLFERTNMNQNQKSTEYKIVRHKLTDNDSGDGDSNYETLINFTDKENSDDKDTFVSVLKDGKMEKNELLTKLYAQFVDEQSIYPSIGLTAALYTDGKIYFNVSNDIVAYNPADGSVAVVKEYNEVSAKRDTSKLFGGMAFTTTSKDNADFTVENHPIAGLTVKGDELVVSIATNYAFISGKSELLDHSSYGYEFEETDYNPTYTNYKKYQQFMGSQSNDNDEFMWSANFVDAVNLKTLTGSSHEFKEVSVPATCGRNAFTEERCSDCGLIKDGSRVEQKDTAHEHHYIKFHEVYYTKSNGTNNEADNYVCPECRACITEPVKSKFEQANSTYEKRKAIWDAAQENAKEGHAYTVTDGEWSEDKTSVTFQNLECKACSEQINKIDCLLEKDDNATNKANRDSIKKTLAEKVTVEAELVDHTGTCETGVSAIYKATGKTEDGTRYTAVETKASEAGEHQYTGEFEWSKKKDAEGKETDEYEATVKNVKCTVCEDEPKAEQITVEAKKDAENSKAATCDEDGVEVWIATATVKSADGSKVVGTLTDKKEIKIDKLGHKYGKTEWKWAEDNKSATATRVCANDPTHVDTAEEVTVEEKSEGATCTKAGKITYTATAKYADGTTENTSKTVDAEALGHDYEEPTWKWSKNDDGEGYTAVATFKCKRGDDEKKEVATVTSDTKAATCEEAGATTYTATVRFNNKDYTTGEKDVKVVEIKATGHAYGEPEMKWTEGENNTYTAKATRVCANDPSHVDEKTAEVTEKPEGATCTEGGKITYTATAKFDDGTECTDTKVKEDVPALGHNYEVTWKWAKDNESAKATFTCSRCKDSHEVDAKVDKKEENGQTVYTATAEYAGITKTDTKTITPAIYYQVHCQDYGWEVKSEEEADLTKWKSNGADSGTVGKSKRLEGIRIQLPEGVSGSVEYRTHIQNTGWETKWKKDGEVSGTSGKSLRLEAIQVKLTGKVADNYDVYYCVHAQNVGWLNWAKNGEEAGTAGYGYRLEAIKIMLVPKGEKAPAKVGDSDKAMEARLVGYQTHVQDFGTQAYVYDGAVAGTSGQAKRMESIRINLPSTMASEGKIEYRSHVQNIGWEKDWKQTNQLSGTTGKSLRLEAIQMKLSGDIAKEYDVYYRVHAQNFGWLGWAKNGEEAGTAGYSYRLEAIQVVMVPKGTENPQLPGVASATKEAFIQK